MGVVSVRTHSRKRELLDELLSDEERLDEFDLESYLGDPYEERKDSDEEPDLTPRPQHQRPTAEESSEIMGAPRSKEVERLGQEMDAFYHSPVAQGILETARKLKEDGSLEFASLDEYDAFKQSQLQPEPEPEIPDRGPVTVWPGPAGQWEGRERPPRAQEFHEKVQAAAEPYEPSGKLFAWTDPDTGTLNVTGNAAEVPPTVAAQEYVTTERRPPEPAAAEHRGPLPSDEGPQTIAAAGYAPPPEGTLPEAVTGLQTAAERGTRDISDDEVQQIAKAAMIETPKNFNWKGFLDKVASSGGTPGAMKAAKWAVEDLRSRSKLPGTKLSQSKDSFEGALSRLPFQSFAEIMHSALDRAETQEPGIFSDAEAGARAFGDGMSFGGDQQLELDFARKLVLADPEVIALAAKSGLSDDELQKLVFPERDAYHGFWGAAWDLAHGWATKKYRGGMPLTRRVRYPMFGQEGIETYRDAWRTAHKEHPDLMDTIARKTVGAIEDGTAWEHYNEQGMLKGIWAMLPTDPLLAASVIFGAIGSGLRGGAVAASRRGALGAASKLEKAAGVVSKARVVVEPLEVAVGAGKKVVGAGVRAAKPGVREAVSKVLPGAEHGIRRAAWKAADEGKFGHHAVARILTMLDDADMVGAHLDKVVEGMRKGLKAGGATDEAIARGGAKIERGATRVQKLQKKKPYLSSKGVRDAEAMLADVKGKPLAKKPLVKNGEPTPLGRVVNYLDTGKGLDTLTDAEKVVAENLRKTFNELKAKMPENVGRIEHYFPRYKPLEKRVKQVEASRRAIGKEISKFWEEARDADIPAIELYKDYEDVVQGLGRRLAAQDIAEVDKEINGLLAGLVKEFEGVRTTEKVVVGHKVTPTVDISKKPHSLEEAKRIARIQRGKGTEAGTAAAERIEKRIAEAEAASKVISKQQKGAAEGRIERLRPQAKLLKKQLGAADKEVKGLEIPKRRVEKLKGRIERFKAEKADIQKGIREMAEGTEKAKRREAWRMARARLEKAEAELKAIQPNKEDVRRYARTLYQHAKKEEEAAGLSQRLYDAVSAQFSGGIRISKPLHAGAEMDAWKRLPSTWKGKVGEGLKLDTLMEEVLASNPSLRGKYGAIPDPIEFIDDLKARGKSRLRVDDFLARAEEEWLYHIEPEESKLLGKIDNLTGERDRIFREALERQADEAIEEAEKGRWIEAARKKVEAIDLEHAKIQAALPPERELEQLAKRLDISYKDRDKLAKDLAAKRKKLREYWDFTKAKPVYKEAQIDAGEEFAKFVRSYSVKNTELDVLEQLHYKLLLRPFKTTMLGYRPAYALRNIQTASGRTINEMLNGVLEGKPWMPSFSKASRDLMHIDKEFIMQSMGSRHIPTTTRGFMGKIPHFVYSLEGGADRLFKGGATVGKVEAEIGRLARLNKVATAKRPLQEIVEELQQKGAITDFADLVRTKGIEEANRIYFNFQERIGLMIGVPGQIFPFAEWGYKNWNYVLKDLVKHPWKLRAWKIGYDQWAHQYQDHPEYAKHVVRLTKDGLLKYLNHLHSSPLWGIGGFQPLMPFLEGTSAYDKHGIEMFEPVLERIMDRAKAEGLSHEDREKLINSESGRLGFKGAGSLRGYLDKNYIAGPQTGYRYNKHAIKEILDIVAQNLSLGPTAQMAMARVGLAKFEGNRMWLGWQNVVEDLGLAASGTKWIEFFSERKGEYYDRKVKQEMDRQKLRGEITDRRKAEIDVGIQRAIVHTVNNIIPLTLRFIPPEDLEKLAIMETRRRALRGQVAISETSPHDVMAHQLETGKDYPAAKFDVEAERAQKTNEYSRIREIASGGGELVALVPARLSTKSEEIEAKRVNAAVNAIANAPDGERAGRLEAYGLESVVLSDSSKPARKRLDGDYYERAHKFIVATPAERKAMADADAEMQMFELGTKGFDFGPERIAKDAKQYVQRLAADAIAAGDRDSFEQKLADTEIEALVTRLPDGQQFMNEVRSKVMKGTRTAPDNLRTHIEKISQLVYQGAAKELIGYTNGLSNEAVAAIKDHVGEGNYKQMLKDADEISEYNKADSLFKGVMQAEDRYRAYNDLNTKDQNLIDKWFPESDVPEWVADEKKHNAEQSENDEWKRRIADSNYDVRMRKMVPIDVKRRLGNEHQFWFDFFYPVELTLAQKELQREHKAKQKKLETEREKRKEFLVEARKWKQQILNSDFDRSFKGSRVPMEVKRYLADKDKKFEDFFFGKSGAGSGRGSRKRPYPHTAKARPGVSAPAKFRPAQTDRRRRKIVPTARGQKRTDAFGSVAAKVGKPK